MIMFLVCIWFLLEQSLKLVFPKIGNNGKHKTSVFRTFYEPISMNLCPRFAGGGRSLNRLQYNKLIILYFAVIMGISYFYETISMNL